MTGPYDSYQAMHLVYRRVTNSLSTPFAFFPKYPPLLPGRQEMSRVAPDNAAGKPRTEWVEIFSYCVKSCGIYIASPSDSTWLGILRTNYVGGVAQLVQLLMRTLTSLQTRTYPTYSE